MTEPDITAPDAVAEFFSRYRKALLGRDAAAMSHMYAVPALIVFPGTSIAVSSTAQTEAFFAGSWGQYDGVREIDHELEIMAAEPASVWAVVTWTYGGRAQERFCYQLVPDDADGHRIAVLTPMVL